MKSFKDNAGRMWTIAINVAAIKRVRGLLGIDLYTAADNKLKPLAELVSDPLRLVDVLYCLCFDQCTAAGVSDEDFGRGMGGDALGMAGEAFALEYVDFFPDARMRAVVTKAIAKDRKVRDRLMDHAEAQIAAIDPETSASELIASFGVSPASSASTPDPSLSAN